MCFRNQTCDWWVSEYQKFELHSRHVWVKFWVKTKSSQVSKTPNWVPISAEYAHLCILQLSTSNMKLADIKKIIINPHQIVSLLIVYRVVHQMTKNPYLKEKTEPLFPCQVCVWSVICSHQRGESPDSLHCIPRLSVGREEGRKPCCS